MDWTEVMVEIPAEHIETAEAICQMVVPYGIYIEDYRNLEQDAWEIAHIDLIDEELLKKDRSKGIIHLYIPPTEHPAEASAFISERLKEGGIDNTISLKMCRNEDWENNWKEYFKPLPVGKKLLIRPLWEREYDPQGRTVLDIEPGLAFGTGGHHTTRLCLETLENYISEETDILDVGCGSGILSIAALLLGAKSAQAVDIDSLAVKTAIENGKINGFEEPKYKVFHGDLTDKITGKFDVIAANIVADIIIMFSSQVGEFLKDDGVFITSGIIDTREKEVLEAFEKNNFKVIERHEDSGWLCFVCKKAD